MLNIVLFGAPGCGKGTQASLLKEKYGIDHVSTGEVIRDQIARGTQLGKEMESYTSQGKLAPDQIVIDMIDHYVTEHQHAKGNIFDGFPRNLSQARLLEGLMEELRMPFAGVLSLEVPREELIIRLINRGKVSGRSDDKEEVIIERLKEYEEKTLPVAEYFSKKGNFYPVKGVGSLDEIFDRLVAEIEKHSNPEAV